jgi:hypothetical protein
MLATRATLNKLGALWDLLLMHYLRYEPG